MVTLKEALIVGVTGLASLGRVFAEGPLLASPTATWFTCVLTAFCGIVLVRISNRLAGLDQKVAFMDSELFLVAKKLKIKLPERK